MNAMERTGSPTKAALEVLEIGSKGSKDIYNSARAAGSQMLARINVSLLDAYERKGITAEKLADKNMALLDDEKPEVVLKALDTAIKVGVGGGYSADKHINLNVNTNPSDMDKFSKIREEYEQKLLKEIGGTND